MREWDEDGSCVSGAGLAIGRHGQGARRRFPGCARRFSPKSTRALGRKSVRARCSTGPEAELTLTANAQPALMAASLAAIARAGERGWARCRSRRRVCRRPFARRIFRACAAGALTIEDAARLLRIRGEAMQSAVPVGEGAMAAILGLDFAAFPRSRRRRRAISICTGAICQAANDNGGGQVVISGTKAAVERAMELAKAEGRQARAAAAGFRALPLRADAAGGRRDGRRARSRRRSGAAAAARRQCSARARSPSPRRSARALSSR